MNDLEYKSGLEKEKKELQNKCQDLDFQIEEARVVDEGLKSRFWGITRRTLNGLKESYTQEAYRACETTLKHPGPFLGRMEMVDHIIQIMETNFADGCQKALDEKQAAMIRIQEIQDILDNKAGTSYTGGTGEI